MSDTVSAMGPNPASAAPHPSVEAWIDYYEGRAPGEEKDGLRQHLSGCRQCLDLMLDLDAFAAPSPSPAGAVADFEKAAVWRAVKGAIEPRATLWVRHWPAIAGVAASLMFATLGLSAWNQQHDELNQLRSQVAALSKLQANAVIRNLRPGTRERGSGRSAASVDLGDETRMLVLILNLLEAVDSSAYEVRIFDSSGNEVARIPELEISEIGNFQIAMTSDLFRAGNYELQLFGLEGESEQELGIFPIKFR